MRCSHEGNFLLRHWSEGECLATHYLLILIPEDLWEIRQLDDDKLLGLGPHLLHFRWGSKASGSSTSTDG